jgi:hypothetical protein
MFLNDEQILSETDLKFGDNFHVGSEPEEIFLFEVS